MLKEKKGGLSKIGSRYLHSSIQFKIHRSNLKTSSVLIKPVESDILLIESSSKLSSNQFKTATYFASCITIGPNTIHLTIFLAIGSSFFFLFTCAGRLTGCLRPDRNPHLDRHRLPQDPAMIWTSYWLSCGGGGCY